MNVTSPEPGNLLRTDLSRLRKGLKLAKENALLILLLYSVHIDFLLWAYSLGLKWVLFL